MSMKTIDMFVRELNEIVKASEKNRERAQGFKERLMEEVSSDQFGADLLNTMITLLNKGVITREQIELDDSSEDGTIFITYIIKPKKGDAAQDNSKEVA